VKRCTPPPRGLPKTSLGRGRRRPPPTRPPSGTGRWDPAHRCLADYRHHHGAWQRTTQAPPRLGQPLAPPRCPATRTRRHRAALPRQPDRRPTPAQMGRATPRPQLQQQGRLRRKEAAHPLPMPRRARHRPPATPRRRTAAADHASAAWVDGPPPREGESPAAAVAVKASPDGSSGGGGGGGGEEGGRRGLAAGAPPVSPRVRRCGGREEVSKKKRRGVRNIITESYLSRNRNVYKLFCWL
jgi:hypothetical protein